MLMPRKSSHCSGHGAITSGPVFDLTGLPPGKAIVQFIGALQVDVAQGRAFLLATQLLQKGVGSTSGSFAGLVLRLGRITRRFRISWPRDACPGRQLFARLAMILPEPPIISTYSGAGSFGDSGRC